MIDDRTVSDIYQKHIKELLVYVCGFVKVKETAEDILHDAFVRLIQYSLKYPLDESNIRAFLYKTARNICIDYMRKNRKKHETPLHDNIEYTGSRSMHEDVEYNELKQRVAELIEKKDPISRSVYIMRIELSQTYEEIAKNLGISERTAIRKMKSMLEYLSETIEKHGFKIFFIILLAVIIAKFVI
ncbi:MAG: hypothetical protein A2176_15230 [Spirochaetes bacterium RBG_13_51_14]|nr:MAG: hypothetical protein A2176_15230 [Spirochaetes bacterium RBG_13_51_14]